jgi:hypothetical protein
MRLIITYGFTNWLTYVKRRETKCKKNIYSSLIYRLKVWNSSRRSGLFFSTFNVNKLIHFLITKPTRFTNFSNLFWDWNTTGFGQFLCPSSEVTLHSVMVYIIQVCGRLSSSSRIRTELRFILILLLLESCLQTCMSYTIAECRVNNSWWWTEELSETCRISFPK